MKIQSVSIFTLFVFIFGLISTQAWANDDEAIAREMTVLLKSSRAVLVQNKSLIKNPTGAGIDVKKFMGFTFANYEKATGKKFAKGAGAMGDAQGKLIQAIEEVVGEVTTGKDKTLDPQGRFLPAIFARKAAARLGKVSGGKIYLKLTTRDGYLINAANKADAWEKSVIDGKFLGAGWEKGKSHSEMATHNGKKAFRLILPEYFKAGCMGCHGGDNGAKVHPNKKPGKEGELGGAISVALYK